jgi:nitrite reductase/ring-hydroxylating ferredoxin subunit
VNTGMNDATTVAGADIRPSFVTPGRTAQDPDDADFGGGTMAPFIFDAWYAIAPSSEVGRALGAIKVLGEPLVYFRAEDGTPVVLDDRCAHRRYSLSKGRLEGDQVQCRYHGFKYGRTGQCLWAPGLPHAKDGAKGLKFGVRAYACAERGPWLWVWMGSPEDADPARIPLPDLQDKPESTICGYKMNPCNYMMIIENLIDLSHVAFLHQAADLEFVAVVPEDAPAPPDGVAWRKIVDSTELALSAALCGGDPKRLVKQTDTTIQFGPSLCFGTVMREPLAGDTEPVAPALMQIAHAITPQDERSTHQFFTLAMSDPFVMDRDEVKHIIQDIVFEQDVEVALDMQATIDNDRRTGRTEFNMAYDRFGLRMRAIIGAMKQREQI